MTVKNTIIIIVTTVLSLLSCQENTSSEMVTRQIYIVEEDSLYFIAGRVQVNDTVSMKHSDGVLINLDEIASDYNDSLFYFSKSQIVPKAAGISTIKFQFDNGDVDSIVIEIIKVNTRLIVKQLPT